MKLKSILTALVLGTTIHAETISISIGPYGSVGGYEIKSTDGWAQSIASAYEPSSRTPLGFLSFCLEKTSYFYDNQYPFSLSDAAVRGGTTTSDPISLGTGYLYKLFATGNLPAVDIEALQHTFWWLENEESYTPGPYDNLLINQFITLDAAKADGSGYGVSAINVGVTPNYVGQDQLVYQVPESAVGIKMMLTTFVALVGIAINKQK